MLTSRFCRHSLLFTILLALGLSSLTGQEAKQPTYLRPKSPATGLTATEVTQPVDEYSFEIFTRLTGSKFNYRLPPIEGYRQIKDGASSIRFAYSQDSSIYFSFSIYAANSFIPELSDEAMQGYINGLETLFAERDTQRIVVDREQRFDPPVTGGVTINTPNGPIVLHQHSRSVTPFNRPYKEVQWIEQTIEMVNEEPVVTSERKYADYFIMMDDGRLFFATFSAPKNIFSNLYSRFDGLLMEIVIEEE